MGDVQRPGLSHRYPISIHSLLSLGNWAGETFQLSTLEKKQRALVMAAACARPPQARAESPTAHRSGQVHSWSHLDPLVLP